MLLLQVDTQLVSGRKGQMLVATTLLWLWLVKGKNEWSQLSFLSETFLEGERVVPNSKSNMYTTEIKPLVAWVWVIAAFVVKGQSAIAFMPSNGA